MVTLRNAINLTQITCVKYVLIELFYSERAQGPITLATYHLTPCLLLPAPAAYCCLARKPLH